METTQTKKTISISNLPPIPDKYYFTIGQASELCKVKPHVLRYWEQEFPQLRPNKRRGNRRYYQRKDLELIRKIRWLLYQEGFTIQGARLQLSSKSSTHRNNQQNVYQVVQQTVDELKDLLQLLEE